MPAYQFKTNDFWDVEKTIINKHLLNIFLAL